MKEVRSLERSLSRKAFLFGLIIGSSILMLGRANLCLGVFLGTLVSILNFKLLAVNLMRFPGLSVPGFVLRYAMVGLILWTAINKGMPFFCGVVIGLFMIRIAIYQNYKKVASKE